MSRPKAVFTLDQNILEVLGVRSCILHWYRFLTRWTKCVFPNSDLSYACQNSPFFSWDVNEDLALF